MHVCMTREHYGQKELNSGNISKFYSIGFISLKYEIEFQKARSLSKTRRLFKRQITTDPLSSSEGVPILASGSYSSQEGTGNRTTEGLRIYDAWFQNSNHIPHAHRRKNKARRHNKAIRPHHRWFHYLAIWFAWLVEKKNHLQDVCIMGGAAKKVQSQFEPSIWRSECLQGCLSQRIERTPKWIRSGSALKEQG